MVFAVGFLLLAQAIVGPIGALAATIQTDLFVYQNGDTVTVTGDGFGVAETVDVVTTDPAATVVDHGSATTDGSGSFSYQFTLNATVSGLYDVKATGEISGLTASTQFDPPDRDTEEHHTTISCACQACHASPFRARPPQALPDPACHASPRRRS